MNCPTEPKEKQPDIYKLALMAMLSYNGHLLVTSEALESAKQALADGVDVVMDVMGGLDRGHSFLFRLGKVGGHNVL